MFRLQSPVAPRRVNHGGVDADTTKSLDFPRHSSRGRVRLCVFLGEKHDPRELCSSKHAGIPGILPRGACRLHTYIGDFLRACLAPPTTHLLLSLPWLSLSFLLLPVGDGPHVVRVRGAALPENLKQTFRKIRGSRTRMGTYIYQKPPPSYPSPFPFFNRADRALKRHISTYIS